MGKVKKVGHYTWALFSVLVVVALLAGTLSYARSYIKSNNEPARAPKSQGQRFAAVSKASLLPIPSLPARPPEQIRRVYTIEDGDSFYEVLKSYGVPAEEALTIIKKTRRVFNTSKIKPGNAIQFIYSPEDQSISEIDYEISDLKKLEIRISGDRIRARKVEMDKEEHFIPTTDTLPAPRERVATPPAVTRQAEGTGKPQAESQAAAEKQEPRVPGMRQIDFKVRKGHSLFDLLSEVGVSRAEIDTFTKSVKGVYNLSSLKPGKTISVWLTQDKSAKIKRLTYEIDDTSYLDVSCANGSFTARTRKLTRDIRIESAVGRISSSLYESAVSDGVNPEIVMRLTDIFAHDINFFSSIQPGDTYAVLYEKYYVKDQFKGYGRVLAAKFVNRGEEHVAIYYDNERKGVQGYYDEKGRPMKKMFLKAPLNYRRISSVFSKHRRHPIFGVVRPHLGVDYAAPMGTPVSSLGQGKVVFKGRDRGYGNALRIRHAGGYITYYGHLSRFAKGIRVGKAVDQGDTVAFVGSTGHSTGPHLDFRVCQSGKFINPLKMKNVNGPPLRGRLLADFKRVSHVRLAMLENKGRSIAMTTPAGKKMSEAKALPRG